MLIHRGFADTDHIKHVMELGLDLFAHHEKLDAELHCQQAHGLSDHRQERTRLFAAGHVVIAQTAFAQRLPRAMP